MKTALIDVLNVPSDVVRVDYAGRRTYDTCIRAHELWGVDRAILVSQDFHLPRAIWTCRRLGIESVGVSASLQPYILGSWYRTRERLARYKAFIDVYLWRPDYIGGAFIEDLDTVVFDEKSAVVPPWQYIRTASWVSSPSNLPGWGVGWAQSGS